MSVDHDDAVAWAASVLGADVRECVRLTGGMTSTMLALTDASGSRSVLRLMTEEPWRTHGAGLTAREQAALSTLAATPVPAPTTLGLDADGVQTGVPAHLMTFLPGRATETVGDVEVGSMARVLATIHDVVPAEPFRDFQSWAPPAKWVVPEWSAHPRSWQRAFDLLGEGHPAFEPTFLHRDYGHRNLLWSGREVCGVVDWVETSTGPAWLDVGHAATNLALGFDIPTAAAFLSSYAALTGRPREDHWLVMDAVGFLPFPGREPMFDSPAQLAALDAWLHALVG